MIINTFIKSQEAQDREQGQINTILAAAWCNVFDNESDMADNIAINAETDQLLFEWYNLESECGTKNCC